MKEDTLSKNMYGILVSYMPSEVADLKSTEVIKNYTRLIASGVNCSTCPMREEQNCDGCPATIHYIGQG